MASPDTPDPRATAELCEQVHAEIPGKDKPWESFYKAKYDEWHVGVPYDNSCMLWPLFPNGAPGDTIDDRQKFAEGIATLRNILPAIIRDLRRLVELEAAVKKVREWDRHMTNCRCETCQIFQPLYAALAHREGQ